MFGRVYKHLLHPHGWLCRSLLAGVLIGAPSLLVGCETGPKMTKVETPAAGVTLAYNLTPGAAFIGNIRRSETISSLSGDSVNRSIEFATKLVVLGPDSERGGTQVRARITNIKLNWALPPAMAAIVNVSDLTNQARKALERTEITFNVDTSGKIIYMPPLPEGISPELGMVIQQVLDALESAFYTVPERALKLGEQWKDDKKRGRKGKLGRYIEGEVNTKFDGLYTLAEGGQTVAKLKSNNEETEVTTAKSGSHEVRRQGESTILFATQGGYLLRTDSELRTFDAGNSTTHTNVNVVWKEAPSQPVAPATETQAITDPCSPDYVGGEDCVPEGAETQAITDPCNPDYVGAGECSESAAPGETPTEPAPAEVVAPAPVK